MDKEYFNCATAKRAFVKETLGHAGAAGKCRPPHIKSKKTAKYLELQTLVQIWSEGNSWELHLCLRTSLISKKSLPKSASMNSVLRTPPNSSWVKRKGSVNTLPSSTICSWPLTCPAPAPVSVPAPTVQEDSSSWKRTVWYERTMPVLKSTTASKFERDLFSAQRKRSTSTF